MVLRILGVDPCERSAYSWNCQTGGCVAVTMMRLFTIPSRISRLTFMSRIARCLRDPLGSTVLRVPCPRRWGFECEASVPRVDGRRRSNLNPGARTAEKTRPPRPDYTGRGDFATTTHGQVGTRQPTTGFRLGDSGVPAISPGANGHTTEVQTESAPERARCGRRYLQRIGRLRPAYATRPRRSGAVRSRFPLNERDTAGATGPGASTARRSCRVGAP